MVTKKIEVNSSSSVVLDTNIVISGGISPSGPNYKIVQMCIAGRFKGIISEELLAEYVEVMARKKFAIYGFPPEWLERFKKILNLVPKPVRSSFNAKDKKDQMLVDLAHAFSAILVTGNMDDFPEDFQQKITCLSPAEFLKVCEAEEKTVDVENETTEKEQENLSSDQQDNLTAETTTQVIAAKVSIPVREKRKLCGAKTQKGGYCQRRGNCPNHA